MDASFFLGELVNPVARRVMKPIHFGLLDALPAGWDTGIRQAIEPWKAMGQSILGHVTLWHEKAWPKLQSKGADFLPTVLSSFFCGEPVQS